MGSPVARFVLVLVSVGLYCALAVLGWGGFTAFAEHAALLVLAMVVLALSLAALFAGGNLSSGVREDRESARWGGCWRFDPAWEWR